MSKTLMKYLVPSILLSFTSAVNADYNDNNDSNYCEPKPCPPKDCCAKCAQLWPTGGPDWIITPGAGPCVSCGADVSITAEFIYWTARQDNMQAASIIPNTQTQDAQPSRSVEKGYLVYPDWEMSPGFKVGLGMLFDCDGWDLYANYTWLRPRTKHTKTPSSDQTLNFFDSGIFDGSHDSITYQWDLDFNVVDLELGRNFFISQCLHLRPHFGFKGHWQEQDRTLTLPLSSDAVVAGDLIVDQNMSYWGVGLRAGLDSAWHFSRCFSLVGEAAASALWQYTDSCVTGSQPVQSTAVTGFAVSSLKGPYYNVRGVLELFFGLRWEDWFCCDEYHWSAEAGWEFQWWPEVNQFFYGNSNVIEATGGDLGLQGFTLKFRFDF